VKYIGCRWALSWGLINVGVGVIASFLVALFVFLIFAAFIAVGFLLSGAIVVVGRANNRE
jgi:hypothetical protein